MAESASTNRSNSTITARLQSMMSFLALVVRILLWPLRRASSLVFPLNDLDGLSPAVTAKAAQSFVSMLRKQYPSNDSELWSSTGFAALKNEATASKSLILVYLYSPLHRQANHVVDHILTTRQFQEFLNQPHLVAMGFSIHSGQGLQLAQMLNAASFPLVALLEPQQSTLSLMLSVQGPVLLEMTNPNTLLTYMNTALTRHQVQLAEQEARRIQREEEQLLRQQQDAEYHATLRADQERQRQLREEEEARIQAEREAAEQESAARRELDEKLHRARNAVRPPPAEGGTMIRFVLPSGKKLVRSFESDETIGSLKAFLLVTFHEDEETENIERIALSTNYPKKTYEDEDVTLEEAGLSPQAVLMVQDLDA
jgi:FAS-associated factor 2